MILSAILIGCRWWASGFH